MTTSAWIDATCGAAGDMILAALLDAGADKDAVETALAALSSAAGEPMSLELSPVRRHGLRASLAEISCEPSTTERGLSDVLDLLATAPLPALVHHFAASVFRHLAAAESHVHGVTVDEIRFHEVGALDSLADVVGSATALHSLGLLDANAAITVSTIGVGSGSVRAGHGVLPVPVPAVVEVLAAAGAPASAGPGDGELCTPTGAALLAAMSTGWGPLPAMTVRSSGCGAGGRDTPGHANIVRVIVGDQVSAPQSWRVAELRLVESTIDDLDPRLWPDALEALQTAGAIDAWLTPTLMRNGRPGQLITALSSPDTVDSIVRALFRATTTLGARVTDVQRISLQRDTVEVDVAGHKVRVKRGILDGQPVTLQPEFADARAAALSADMTIADVIDTARELGRDASSEAEAHGC